MRSRRPGFRDEVELQAARARHPTRARRGRNPPDGTATPSGRSASPSSGSGRSPRASTRSSGSSSASLGARSLYASPPTRRSSNSPPGAATRIRERCCEVIHPDDRERMIASHTDERDRSRPPSSSGSCAPTARSGGSRPGPRRCADRRRRRGADRRHLAGYHGAARGRSGSCTARSSRLRQSEHERRSLVRQLVRASEEERARLAGDVHDDSVQAMTAVGIRLETLKRKLDAPGPRRAEARAGSSMTVSDAVARLRHLLFELRPPALDQHGAAAALRESLDRLEVATRPGRERFRGATDWSCATILVSRRAGVTRERAEACQGAAGRTSPSPRTPTGWRALIADDGIGIPIAEDLDPRPRPTWAWRPCGSAPRWAAAGPGSRARRGRGRGSRSSCHAAVIGPAPGSHAEGTRIVAGPAALRSIGVVRIIAGRARGTRLGPVPPGHAAGRPIAPARACSRASASRGRRPRAGPVRRHRRAGARGALARRRPRPRSSTVTARPRRRSATTSPARGWARRRS